MRAWVFAVHQRAIHGQRPRRRLALARAAVARPWNRAFNATTRPVRFSTAGVDECWGKRVDNPRTPRRGAAPAGHGEKMTSARRFIHRGCGWSPDKHVDKRRSALQGRRVKRIGTKMTRRIARRRAAPWNLAADARPPVRQPGAAVHLASRSRRPGEAARFAPPARRRPRQRALQSTARSAITALSPPKAKELLSTARTGRARARLGT